jgi:hypothetical protein
MSKPIFIVRFPNTAEHEHLNYAAESLNKLGFYDDYNILVMKDQFTEGEIKFECYNSPHTEMEFKELQNRVISLLSKNEKNK